MTPVEEFIHNSDRLKTAILNEALLENTQLRERIADLESELANQRATYNLVSSKLVTMEVLHAKLLRELDDMK